MINDPLSLIVGVKTTFSLKVVRSKTCIDKSNKTLYPLKKMMVTRYNLTPINSQIPIVWIKNIVSLLR